MDGGKTGRGVGVEMRGLLWLARHPLVVGVPAITIWAAIAWGWQTPTAAIVAAVVVLVVWFRAHPDTFDRFAAPVFRSTARRWRVYVGPRWGRAARACELTKTDRRSGRDVVPRIVRVRSWSPSVDTVTVRMAPGQNARVFEAKLTELADTLRVERVAAERVKPGYVGLVVERKEPFVHMIPAPDMPEDSAAVDLSSVYVGETEHGHDWRIPTKGKQVFIAGATGAGKNSVLTSILRGLAPMIRDGLVRLWVCDPKQFEFTILKDICCRYANTEAECAELISDFVDDMHTVQRGFATVKTRARRVTRETPVNLLILDELGALLAYGDVLAAREMRRHLALVASQGRATGHSLIGMVQEPTKDTVSIRDLFTWRICMRLTAATQVDGVLGDNARLRGALADEIPDLPEAAGIGYVVRQRSRVPLRVRAAYVNDAELAELVAFVQAGWHQQPLLVPAAV